MNSLYQIVQIEGKGFGCMALKDIKVKNIFFSLLVPSKREKNMSVLFNLYIFWGKCFYFSISSFKNWKINIFPQKIYKLSKTNIFFSHFEGTRGEKTKYFAPKMGTLIQEDIPQFNTKISRFNHPCASNAENVWKNQWKISRTG